MPQRLNDHRSRVLGVAVAAALALPGVAGAFEVNTGNEDLAVRFDNTARFNSTMRVASPDAAAIANPNFDDGNRTFDKNHLFARFDLLTELDVVWKRSMGFRVTAASWWDPGYSGIDQRNVDTANNLENGLPSTDLPDHTNRYAQGPSAEFLDVFAFAKFDVGQAPVNVKLGQTTVYWGESLLFGGALHGISYAQNPIDVWKGLATPGAEAKELYRPRTGFNVQAQVTDTLSLAGQYFFNWQSFDNQAYRYPEAGSFLSIGDPLLYGGESYITSPNPFAAVIPGAPRYLRAWRGEDIEPEEDTGNYGVAVRWSPTWLDGTVGFYYRRNYDMQPQLMLTPGVANGVPSALCTATGGIPINATTCLINQQATNVNDLRAKGKMGEYNLAYGEEVDLYGISLSKQVFGVSVGAEFSYRENMPLLSEAVQVIPDALLTALTAAGRAPAGAIAVSAVPEHGTPGATGSTMHGLVNVLGVVGDTPLFDTANYAAEVTWMQWDDVEQNEAVFKGRSGYTLIDAVDKNYYGLGVNFTPTWFQVFPGVDMLAPLSWSQGISGNSAVTSGGQDGAGTYGIGVAWDVRQKYRFDLKYVGFYGDNSKCPRPGANPATCVNGAVDLFNGANATLADRDFIAFTFKTTF